MIQQLPFPLFFLRLESHLKFFGSSKMTFFSQIDWFFDIFFHEWGCLVLLTIPVRAISHARHILMSRFSAVNYLDKN